MHARLPDYDDSQGYDLGAGGILSQFSLYIARLLWVWQTS